MPSRLFSLVNLGCPKNTVDSEGILATLSRAGFQFVPEPLEADICIVNTCGFLDAARREAQGVLQDLAAGRARRRRPLLVAAGCLVERIGGASELGGFLRRADARVGFADYPRLPKICTGLLEGNSGLQRPARGYAGRILPESYQDWLSHPRMRIGLPASAYLKLGEGCSNNCAYCSIPMIRGRRASRAMPVLLKEARELVASGAQELNLIAQDTTAYAMDIAGESQLASLLRELLKISGLRWLRVLYAHPRHLTDGILATMASDGRICPYLDLPLQHVNDKMLKIMGRGYGRARVDEILGQVRQFLPGAALRTSFITGHPGEGEPEFAELLEFVKEGHFDHVGVFVWSPEPGTVSEKLAGRVPMTLGEARRESLMAVQGKVSAARLRARRGEHPWMLLERKDKKSWHGRTPWQAPEVDGETVLEDAPRDARAGDFIRVKITRTGRYDVQARLVKS